MSCRFFGETLRDVHKAPVEESCLMPDWSYLLTFNSCLWLKSAFLLNNQSFADKYNILIIFFIFAYLFFEVLYENNSHVTVVIIRLVSGAGDIKLTKDGNVLLHEMVG